MSARIATQFAIVGGKITYLSIHLKIKGKMGKEVYDRSSSLNNVRSQAAFWCLYYCEISGVTVIVNVLYLSCYHFQFI